jgi:predicted PurR-regulated permease PerM
LVAASPPSERLSLTPVSDDHSPEPHAEVTDAEVEMPLPSNPQTFFLGGIFALSVFATLYLASSIILPVVLAFVLKLLLQPIVRLLERLHLPRSVGALLTVLLAIGTLVGLVAGLSVAAANWTTKLPDGIRFAFPFGNSKSQMAHAGDRWRSRPRGRVSVPQTSC